ncbi:MAG: hypothetical protein GYB67_00725 [Chloroflexi bacterium]|nr:hypothetical protein [Chloroflexota bacterium]
MTANPERQMERQPLPYWYQREDVKHIYDQIEAGEFCELVGIGSGGKSNLVNLAVREDVKAHYLGPQKAPYVVVVLLNPHLLVKLEGDARSHTGTLWAGYELMLNRLRRQLFAPEHQQIMPETRRTDLNDAVEAYYINMYHQTPVIAQAGIRHLEDVIYELLSMDEEWRIAFIFDEFEQFIDSLNAEFFQSLRGLRDAYKGRVMYVTTSREPLKTLMERRPFDDHQRALMEGFVELFGGHRRYIRPLDEQSANEAIRRLESRFRQQMKQGRLRPSVASNLIYVSGGHVGLLRRSFLPASTTIAPRIADDKLELIRALVQHPGVADECQAMINSLSQREIAVLKRLLRDRPIEDDEAWISLRHKHLVDEDRNGRHYWQIPLLAAWCAEHEAEL